MRVVNVLEEGEYKAKGLWNECVLVMEKETAKDQESTMYLKVSRLAS